jgi:hypothetical protein
MLPCFWLCLALRRVIEAERMLRRSFVRVGVRHLAIRTHVPNPSVQLVASK